MFNALLVASELALAEVADRLGTPAQHHRERAQGLSHAMQQHLFDSALGVFVSVDVRRWRHRRVRTVGGLVPLLLPDLESGQRRALLATLVGPAFRVGSPSGRAVASYDLTAADLDVRRYWRGPSWVSTSWLVWRGLRQCGQLELAARLAGSVVDLVARAGFREYFHPSTGEGLGARDFSWSAALVLDLLSAESAED
jgi:neutral trehalase